MPLTKADTSKTETFRDGAAWLELRTQITKEVEDTIQDLNSHYRLPPSAFGLAESAGDGDGVELRTNAREINRTLFDLLAVAWSVGEEKPTAADYDTLTSESGRWVDQCVNQALAIGRGRAEKNAPSSRKRKSSRTSSRPAARSSSTDSPRTSDD